jgi:chaperone required for assembly of F1-ATPase
MLDPKAERAARESMRGPSIRRFYKEAAVAETLEGFTLTLDGRRAMTPRRRPLVLPSRALAETLAAEWAAQGETLAPATMPLTRLSNSALDGVADALGETRAAIAAYAESDLACFRAERPESLIAAQEAGFAPVLAFARDSLGASFKIGAGIMPIRQSLEALAVVRTTVDAVESPLALAALHTAVSLTSSALLGLALQRRAFAADHVWRLAHIDEDHQIALWGEDEEAAERRSNRWIEMQMADRVFEALAPVRLAS